MEKMSGEASSQSNKSPRQSHSNMHTHSPIHSCIHAGSLTTHMWRNAAISLAYPYRRWNAECSCFASALSAFSLVRLSGAFALRITVWICTCVWVRVCVCVWAYVHLDLRRLLGLRFPLRSALSLSVLHWMLSTTTAITTVTACQ